MQTLLVVGSTGLLGDAVVREALSQGWEVRALVRNLDKRRSRLNARWPGAVLIEGDVSLPGLGLRADAVRSLQDVTMVLDAFGRFEFGMTNVEAELNVDGALEALRFAAALPRLRAYGHVGGYRVGDGGAESGLGAYERSKRRAVERVEALANELRVPLAQLHPASVIGDSRTGETSQTLGLGELVRELYLGRLPALVGPRGTWVPLVFSDDFARVTLAALEERVERSETTAHWILDEGTPRLVDLVAEFAGLLGVPAPTRRVPKALVRALPRRLTGVEPETLTFLDARTYPTDTLRALRDKRGIVAPPRSTGLRRWVEHLLATDFLTRPGRGRLAAGTFVGQLGEVPGRLVLLHGLPLEHGSWAPLVRALGRGAHAPDLAGLGRSAPGRPTGRWLEGLLDELGLGQAVLVAHSYGCVPALELAVAHPERVAGLVLVSPFFLQPRASPVFRCALAGSMVFASLSEERLGEALFREAAPAVTSRAHSSLQRRGVAKAHAQLLAQASRRSERRRLRHLLARVDVPLRLIHGADDPIEGGGEAIENAGHIPQVDAPRRTAAVIEGFLGGLPRDWTSEVARPTLRR